MILKILGCGDIDSVKYRNSQFLFTQDNNAPMLLIDAGMNTKESLCYNGLTIEDIPNIYITHPHVDHIGGLGYIGQHTIFTGGDKPKLIGHTSFIDNIWENYLRYYYSNIEYKSLYNIFTPCFLRDLEFNLTECNIDFKLVKTLHDIPGNTTPMYTYGLFFKTPSGKKVYITGDTILAITKAHIEADIIFQDCEIRPSKLRTGVHAHYLDLNSVLSNEIKSKMFLYHYSDDMTNVLRNEALSNGFGGIVNTGDEFEL